MVTFIGGVLTGALEVNCVISSSEGLVSILKYLVMTFLLDVHECTIYSYFLQHVHGFGVLGLELRHNDFITSVVRVPVLGNGLTDYALMALQCIFYNLSALTKHRRQTLA